MSTAGEDGPKRVVHRPAVAHRLVLSPLHTFVFLWFEPIAALSGAAILLLDPQAFLTTMSPLIKLSLQHRVIYAQLAATYVLFALNELVLLRVASYGLAASDARRVWRTILGIILVCDLIHIWGSWEALGNGVFWDPRLWRWQDWVNLGSLWVQGAVRVLFLLDIGVEIREERHDPTPAPKKKSR